jgi:hypothetical protein
LFDSRWRATNVRLGYAAMLAGFPLFTQSPSNGRMNFVAATSRPSPYLRFNVGLKITVIPRWPSNDAEPTFDNRLLDRSVFAANGGFTGR